MWTPTARLPQVETIALKDLSVDSAQGLSAAGRRAGGALAGADSGRGQSRGSLPMNSNDLASASIVVLRSRTAILRSTGVARR